MRVNKSEFEKLLDLLNPQTEEEKETCKRILADYFSETQECELTGEKLMRISKELPGSMPKTAGWLAGEHLRRALGLKPKAKSQASVAVAETVLRQLTQAGPKHPLAGMAGGPGVQERGIGPGPVAISKEAIQGLAVLKEGGSFQPAPGVQVKRLLFDTYRITAVCKARPGRSWSRQAEWPTSIWTVETRGPEIAVQEALVAVAQKEVAAGHPLRQMFGSVDRPTTTQQFAGRAVVKENSEDSLRDKLVQGAQRREKRIVLLPDLIVYPSADGRRFKLEFFGDFQPQGFKLDDQLGTLYWAVTDLDHAVELAENVFNKIKARGVK